MDTSIYPSSLIPKKQHDYNMIRVVESPVTPHLILYIASQIQEIIPLDDEYVPKSMIEYTLDSPDPEYPSPPASPSEEDGPDLDPLAPPLYAFVSELVYNSGAHVATLLGALVYMHRMKLKMPPRISAQTPSTHHRLFLAALVLASKYLNDSNPTNGAWEEHCNHLFLAQDILLMERELLLMLDYELGIFEIDIDQFIEDFDKLICLAHIQARNGETYEELDWCYQTSRYPPRRPIFGDDFDHGFQFSHLDFSTISLISPTLLPPVDEASVQSQSKRLLSPMPSPSRRKRPSDTVSDDSRATKIDSVARRSAEGLGEHPNKRRRSGEATRFDGIV